MRLSWTRPPRWSRFLLGIWLVAVGALQLVPALAFQGSSNLLAVLGIAAGVLILLER
jgi:hypothetical protein